MRMRCTRGACCGACAVHARCVVLRCMRRSAWLRCMRGACAPCRCGAHRGAPPRWSLDTPPPPPPACPPSGQGGPAARFQGPSRARLESRPLERVRVRKHRRRDRRRAAPRREQRLQQLRQRFVPRVRANRLPPQPPPYSAQPPPAARVACELQLALEQRGHERRVVPLHLDARVRPGCTGLQPGYAAAGAACRSIATAASVELGPCPG